MQVVAKRLGKWANEVLEKVMDKDGDDHERWIVAQLVCAMQYINNARYMPGDTTLAAKMLNNSRENNTHFLQGKSLSSPQDTSCLRIFSGQALPTIALGNVLIVRYAK